MNINILIQARMGSSRLPKKMMRPLDGLTIFEWVLTRVSDLDNINNVVVCTPDTQENVPLQKMASNFGYAVFAGPEDDVVSRFDLAMKKFPADYYIRVCADNPFVSPRYIAQLVEAATQNTFDYASNQHTTLTPEFVDGLGAEIFSNLLGKHIAKNARSANDREHFFNIFHQQQNQNFIKLKLPSLHDRPEIKLDIDTKKDWELIREFVRKEGITPQVSDEALIHSWRRFEYCRLMERLYPLNRCLAGEANRQTLNILEEIIPLSIGSIASGTQVFDWVVPDEWKLKKGRIQAMDGSILVDCSSSTLVVGSHSTAVDRKISIKDLKKHLHVGKKSGERPYRTNYYNNTWSFSVTPEEYNAIIKNEHLQVIIDAEKISGDMNYGEYIIPGKSQKEILISCYICHPSMANDSLSGVLVCAKLAQYLSARIKTKYTYRFIFIPETIGAIAYLSQEKLNLSNDFVAGMVITTCGGRGQYEIKNSWDEEHRINTYVRDVLNENKLKFVTHKFDVHGSDERQFSAPGQRLNCVTIAKSKYYSYEEYHTSSDNLSYVDYDALCLSEQLYIGLCEKFENERVFDRYEKNCELMLSKRGLYPKDGGALIPSSNLSKLDLVLWCLFYADGRTTVSEISNKIKVSNQDILNTFYDLVDKEVVFEVN